MQTTYAIVAHNNKKLPKLLTDRIHKSRTIISILVVIKQPSIFATPLIRFYAISLRK